MKIGVIGYGYVGRATGEGFSSNPKNKVFWYDKFKPSRNTFEEVVDKSELIFICVPTPIFSSYKGMDMSVVREVAGQVAKLIGGSNKILVIKSTSLPGTTRELSKKYRLVNFVTNPEFLTQKNANRDFLNPTRTVVGCDSWDVGRRVVNAYRKILPRKQPYIVTDPTSAEVIKFMSNIVLAGKIIMANEFYLLSKKLGANYIDVQKGVESDPRIGTHLGVPGPDGDLGFGGACFPKDTVGILGLARKLKVDMGAINAIWRRNLKLRKRRDWESLPQAFNKKK